MELIDAKEWKALRRVAIAAERAYQCVSIDRSGTHPPSIASDLVYAHLHEPLRTLAALRREQGKTTHTEEA